MDMIGFLHSEQVAFYLVLISGVLGLMALIPQIVLNYRSGQANGISDFMLFGFFNAFMAGNVYIFCANLPWAYKISGPLCTLVFFIIMVQRIAYHWPAWKFLIGWMVNAAVYAAVIPFVTAHQGTAAFVFGWLNVFMWTVYQLPQVYKIYSTRSVQGFSLLFVSSSALQAVLELTAALVLHLPLQTVVHDIRCIIVSLVFFIQFFMYG